MFGGIVSLLTTTFGALGVLYRPSKESFLSVQMKALSLDFAIGMMVTASAFSLIGPAFQAKNHSFSSVLVLAALMLGILFIKVTGHFITKNFHHQQGRAAVFVTAVLLHNFPEGLAAGLGDSQILWAIGIQNVPEGLATALAFVSLGFSAPMAFLLSSSSGLIEMLGALFGEYFALGHNAQPFMMAFAGGAMMSAAISELRNRINESKFQRKDFFKGAVLLLLLSSFA